MRMTRDDVTHPLASILEYASPNSSELLPEAIFEQSKGKPKMETKEALARMSFPIFAWGIVPPINPITS